VHNISLDTDEENRLFDMLQRKSIPELQQYLQQLPFDDTLRNQFHQLALLNGDISIIEDARKVYADCGEDLHQAIDHMQAVVEAVQLNFPETLIHCDLSELRGYSYHTGLVFAAFLPGHGKEIARGGRYDDVGSVFGNARPATGFSADLINLYQLSTASSKPDLGILAPDNNDPEMAKIIKTLRQDKQRVIVDLTGGVSKPLDQQCNRKLVRQADGWVVEEV
jgi:ATP phosphoribosyltransferase regulatory subunit